MLQCPPPTERGGGEWKRGVDIGNWTVVERLDMHVDVSKSSQVKRFTQIGGKEVPRRVVITAISYHPANRDVHESSICISMLKCVIARGVDATEHLASSSISCPCPFAARPTHSYLSDARQDHWSF